MSEIKFACPHCRQHIACDSGYASLDIECPSCGGMMVVPRLTDTGALHTGTVLVASTPSPAPRPVPQVPRLDTWSQSQWQQHYDKVVGSDTSQFPPWIVAAVSSLILAAVLRATGAPPWMMVLCIVGGAIAAGILLKQGKPAGNRPIYEVLKVLAFVCAAMVILPIIAIGILFVGCMACH
jgi:hypothetical protein